MLSGDSSSLAEAMDPLANIASTTRNRDRNLPLGESVSIEIRSVRNLE